jgi:hypothetical protein
VCLPSFSAGVRAHQLHLVVLRQLVLVQRDREVGGSSSTLEPHQRSVIGLQAQRVKGLMHTYGSHTGPTQGTRVDAHEGLMLLSV